MGAAATCVLGLMPLLFLLFPDGRPVSPRWRHVVRLGQLGLFDVVVFAGMLGKSDDPRLPNPYDAHLPGVVQVGLGVLLLVSLPGALAGGLMSLAIRYRRARGVERQQVAWLLYGAGLVVALLLLNNVLPGDWAFVVGLALPPLCIGVAVLRLRLYEIDRLVSRTISYAVLTAAIALPYFLLVTGASLLVGDNHVAVAMATLVGAAVFNPLAAGFKDASTAGSTALATTLPARSRHSAPDCVTRSTWTASVPT